MEGGSNKLEGGSKTLEAEIGYKTRGVSEIGLTIVMTMSFFTKCPGVASVGEIDHATRGVRVIEGGMGRQ
mgnify:CR=1 FL=1